MRQHPTRPDLRRELMVAIHAFTFLNCLKRFLKINSEVDLTRAFLRVPDVNEGSLENDVGRHALQTRNQETDERTDDIPGLSDKAVSSPVFQEGLTNHQDKVLCLQDRGVRSKSGGQTRLKRRTVCEKVFSSPGVRSSHLHDLLRGNVVNLSWRQSFVKKFPF